MEYLAKKESDLISVSPQLLEDFKSHKVFALKGKMGAGKTTLIRYLMRAMGVTDEVSSPTYGYVNEYHSPYYGAIYHFDLYRIESEVDAYDIGIEEYLYSDKSYVFLEWAELIENLLPENTVWIEITCDKENQRLIRVKSDDRP